MSNLFILSRYDLRLWRLWWKQAAYKYGAVWPKHWSVEHAGRYADSSRGCRTSGGQRNNLLFRYESGMFSRLWKASFLPELSAFTCYPNTFSMNRIMFFVQAKCRMLHIWAGTLKELKLSWITHQRPTKMSLSICLSSWNILCFVFQEDMMAWIY